MSDRLLGLLKISLVFLSFFQCWGIQAEKSSSAEKAYSDGNYSGAIDFYKSRIKNEGTSVEVLYNLGNAYVKIGDFGNAALNYERALELDPANKSVRNNLNYVYSKVSDSNLADAKGKKVSVSAEEISFFGNLKSKLTSGVTSNTYAVWAVVFFLIFIVCLSLYLFVSMVVLRKIGFFGGFAAVAITIILLILAVSAAKAVNNRNEAIITSYKTVLLEEPDSNAKPNSLPLNRGTKVMILEADDENEAESWVKVKLNSDYLGWIRADAIEVI